jgi:hypothetical protein
MANLPDGVFYHDDRFIIDIEKQAQIDEAMRSARKKSRRFDPMEAIYPRDHAAFMFEAEQVMLPLGYRLGISFEEEAAKPGFFRRSPKYDLVCHIVLSIDGMAGCLAPPSALTKVMRVCRKVDDPPQRVWVQDFEISGGRMGYAVHAVWAAA